MILLLSSPRRRQRRHAVHGPSSGVVLARSLQPSYNANTAPLGVVFVGGELLLHESTSSTMPAWSLGSCVRRRRRRRRRASCVVSPHANLKSTSPTTPAQVPLGGSYVRGPATAATSSTTSACCAWSLGSCARSLPSYNTSTAPLGVAFVLLLQRPRRL